MSLALDDFWPNRHKVVNITRVNIDSKCDFKNLVFYFRKFHQFSSTASSSTLCVHPVCFPSGSMALEGVFGQYNVSNVQFRMVESQNSIPGCSSTYATTRERF